MAYIAPSNDYKPLGDRGLLFVYPHIFTII